MPQQEDTKLITKGESVFYGFFLRYLWRNEKNGNCFFQISTKQKLLLKEQYQKKEKLRDMYSKREVTWYTLNCNAANFCVPFYEKKTPVRITGYFLSEKKNGYCWDFQITSIQEASEEETVAIEYLASDSFPSISYEDAVTIVRYHGPDVFSYTEKKDIVNQIQKETGLKAQQVKNMLDTIGNTIQERVLYERLGPLGIPYPFCVKAVKMYGTQAENRIKRNPHSCGRRLGLSFAQCDAIAKEYGFSLNYEGRLRGAVYETLNGIANNGNVYASQEEFYRLFYRILNTGFYSEFRPSAIDFFTYVKDILGLKKVNENKEAFVNEKLVKAEGRIAQNILRLSSVRTMEQPWKESLISYAENACQMHYGNQQRGAFPIMLRNRGLKVLLGGPGTGKTTTIKGIIYAYRQMFPDHKIRLCAPTGRAAQRMAESTEMEAVTVHRLLDYRPYGDSNIHKDASNPIQAELIVVDEMSMMDIELFDIFLSAVKTGTTIIFVGDTNQLEAVGAGTILYDLLNMPHSLIDKCELTEVFRQKGGSPIIENAIQVCLGRCNLKSCSDFQIIHTKCSEETKNKTIDLMKQLYNPERPFETQLLCPSRKGEAGINNLNQLLQKELNPGKKGLQYGQTLYRVNDKIMMTANNYDTEFSYYNGDIGVIDEITPSAVNVNIRNKTFHIKRSMLSEMELAYGMTIHKSQGSEFANVVIVMPMDPPSMLVRNLFYTAITRAKKRVYIINEGSAMETAIKTDRSSKRQTTLLAQTYQALEKKVHEQ